MYHGKTVVILSFALGDAREVVASGDYRIMTMISRRLHANNCKSYRLLMSIGDKTTLVPNGTVHQDGITFEFSSYGNSLIYHSLRMIADSKDIIDNFVKLCSKSDKLPNNILMTNTVSAALSYVNNSPQVSFDDIIFSKKDKIIKMIEPFNDPICISKCNILLYGPPGTGKTSIIKAISNYLGRVPYIVSLNLVASKERLYDIMFSDSVHTPFDNFEYLQKLFIFEDFDSDGSCNTRDTKQVTKTDSPKLLLTDILNVFDGLCPLTNCVCVFTTNKINMIDSAFLRAGRIDLLLEVSYPGTNEKKKYIDDHFVDADKTIVDDLLIRDNVTIADINQACKL